MTDDRVYPASKPVANGGGATANPSFPATKAQLYGASRPTYRPQPHHGGRRRHARGCCCRCCCWTIFVLILLVLLAAAAAAIVYLLYRPQRPTFTVSSLKISALNLTSSAPARLTISISLNVTARNPNKKVVYIYEATAIAVSTDDDVVVGQGNFPAFVHETKNTTLLKALISSPNQDLDDSAANKLKGELKSKKGLGLKIVLDTKVKVKMGGLKTPKTGIRVTCEGIKATAPTGKTATTASTSDAKCKVDLRFKIWKIQF